MYLGCGRTWTRSIVSMKSGLEGRNNVDVHQPRLVAASRSIVSMKSGLEGRNNSLLGLRAVTISRCLNEVRPRRPEQWGTHRAKHYYTFPLSQ